MKKAFVNKKFKSDSLNIIRRANDIIEEYQQRDYQMTLRQLYYQFISRDVFPDSWIDEAYNTKNGLPSDTKNTEKNYKRLAGIISEARLAGHIDWDAIVDLGREAAMPFFLESPQDVIDGAKASAANYTSSRWFNQKTYVELWVEKQALSSVLEPVARQFQIGLMVNKGYSSQSAMHDAANRFRSEMKTVGDYDGDPEGDLVWEMHNGGTYVGFDPDSADYEVKGEPWWESSSERNGVILYLGDHDPSGNDMVRDIRERLLMFGVDKDLFKVEKIALTTEQVRRYRPPNNPAKITDPRAAAYIAQHGHFSWEVDALRPEVMVELIESNIRRYIDGGLWNASAAADKKNSNRLVKALEGIKL